MVGTRGASIARSNDHACGLTVNNGNVIAVSAGRKIKNNPWFRPKMSFSTRLHDRPVPQLELHVLCGTIHGAYIWSFGEDGMKPSRRNTTIVHPLSKHARPVWIAEVA